ncbi:acidic mammalian chitinase-like isoform X1 [Homarus americanus]|uniref:acidic mammalian chitinase-like isoform X1 n=1 Tax=Homarus americanus TaxID=6706 RepID=UPI001C46433D|nr:acidic mammalian chitinase-like isoform X1 [Homarus americanus]
MRFLAALVMLALSLSLTESVMVCYVESWAAHRHEKFDVEDIDPNLCTHLLFAFAGITSDGEISVLDPQHELCDNGGDCAFDRFTALKKQNPELVTILSVGGWAEGSEKYSKMAADPAMRKVFISTSMALLKEHDFDGIDMDWEFPTQRNGMPEDKENFVTLMGELADALHAEGMILTAAVSPSKYTIDDAYDVPGLAEHLDLLNVMTYNLHGDWDNYVHHQSGLYPYKDDTGNNKYLNNDFAINYWIELGMPSNKIVMGMPLYTACWTLDDPSQTDYYSPAEGTYSFNYYEFCYNLKMHPDVWVIKTAEGMNEPYAYYEKLWCCYENHTSVAIKANYAKEHNLAGMMVWSLDLDDYQGKCHDRNFDLIRTMVENFSGSDEVQKSQRR